jgi:MFS transporter, PAT family, solute carrier family 33 (acetyl-CoA transportor), member 1
MPTSLGRSFSHSTSRRSFPSQSTSQDSNGVGSHNRQQIEEALLEEGHELAELPQEKAQRASLSSIRSSDHETPLLRPPEEFDSEDYSDDEQMGKRDRPKGKGTPSPAASTLAEPSSPNGHATGAMSGLLEHRRKHASIDSASSASRVSELVSRSSFTLDDPVPQVTQDSNAASKGFWQLPEHDRRNFLLLVLLYFLQGIPMGLATGSVPFLLKPHVSYSQVGVFSLASYPYSLKLLWSPIVDAVWSRKVGRRKSWILPIQTLSGIGMLWLGGKVEQMMKAAETPDGSGVWGFTWWWFSLVFMCATQDIAVDGAAAALIATRNTANVV